MNLYIINSNGTTEVLKARITWSGNYSNVARKLEFSVVYSANDAFLPKINVSVGDTVKLYESKTLLFTGHVFYREKSHNGNEIHVIAYDYGVYLAKNEAAYNFKNLTAEEITKKVCDDFKIPKGQIAYTGIKQSFISTGDSLYEIIMKAYTKAAVQNGKKYLPVMLENKLNVIERGKLILEYSLENGKNLSDSIYSESIEDMVNAVQIIDEKGNRAGEVTNAEWVKNFGKLQKVYRKESGVNATVAARNMLIGIERTGSLEAIGDIGCITGYKIGVKDTFTGLVGLFNIDSDIHVWDNDTYFMNLELNMDEIMDEKTYREKKSKAKVTEPLKFN